MDMFEVFLKLAIFKDLLLRVGWMGALGAFIVLLTSIVYLEIWVPYKLHRFYRRQKVRGPAYRPLAGNWTDIWRLQYKFARLKRQPARLADAALRSMQHLSHWQKLHGSVFTYMEGANVILCVLDTNIIQELLCSKADCYSKGPAGWLWRILHGAAKQDEAQAKVADWMGHCDPQRGTTLKKVLRHGTDNAFQNVQSNLRKTVDHSRSLVCRWGVLLDEGGARVEVDATHDILKTSMGIVLTNLIGSTLSRSDLEMVESVLDTEKAELDKSQTKCSLFGSHFCSSSFSRYGWLNQLLIKTVKARLAALIGHDNMPDPKDLLDLMISSSYGQAGGKLGIQQVVADCQMIVAAQKSTTLLINQTLLLLARHTDWQVQARAEVLDIRPLSSAIDEDGGGFSLNYSKLARLKVLNMILNESLRLSPPIISIEKLCQKRHHLGKFTVLPGTFVQIPIVLLHNSHEIWGDDSYSFRPDRFEKDLAHRRRPFALIPFSAGPSVCLGFNFALQEAKIMLASIVSNFSFRIPSDYAKLPTDPNAAPPLRIRRLMVDDFARATRERLIRTRSNAL